MKIIWQKSALKSFKQIADYIKSKFGNTSKGKFVKTVEESDVLLSLNPEMGPIDPYFSDRNYTFRYLIVAQGSRLVYRIDGDTIYVVAFWDCRCDPEAQAKKIK